MPPTAPINTTLSQAVSIDGDLSQIGGGGGEEGGGESIEKDMRRERKSERDCRGGAEREGGEKERRKEKDGIGAGSGRGTRNGEGAGGKEEGQA